MTAAPDVRADGTVGTTGKFTQQLAGTQTQLGLGTTACTWAQRTQNAPAERSAWALRRSFKQAVPPARYTGVSRDFLVRKPK